MCSGAVAFRGCGGVQEVRGGPSDRKNTTYLNWELVQWQTSARIGELRRIGFVLHGVPGPPRVGRFPDGLDPRAYRRRSDPVRGRLHLERARRRAAQSGVRLLGGRGPICRRDARDDARFEREPHDCLYGGRLGSCAGRVHGARRSAAGVALPRTEEEILVGRVDRIPNLATAESPVWTAIDVEEKLSESTVIRNFTPRALTVHNFGREILAACAAGLGVSDVHELGGTDTVVE